MSDFITPDEAVTTKPLLDGADLASVTWRKLQRHLEAQLHRLRVKNDDPELTEAQTAIVRGAISATKNLLAQGTVPADAVHED